MNPRHGPQRAQADCVKMPVTSGSPTTTGAAVGASRAQASSSLAAFADVLQQKSTPVSADETLSTRTGKSSTARKQDSAASRRTSASSDPVAAVAPGALAVPTLPLAAPVAPLQANPAAQELQTSATLSAPSTESAPRTQTMDTRTSATMPVKAAKSADAPAALVSGLPAEDVPEHDEIPRNMGGSETSEDESQDPSQVAENAPSASTPETPNSVAGEPARTAQPVPHPEAEIARLTLPKGPVPPAVPQPIMGATASLASSLSAKSIPVQHVSAAAPLHTGQHLQQSSSEVTAKGKGESASQGSAGGSSESHSDTRGGPRRSSKDEAAQDVSPASVAPTQGAETAPPGATPTLPQLQHNPVMASAPLVTSAPPPSDGALPAKGESVAGPAMTLSEAGAKAAASAEASPLSAIAAARLIRTAAGSELRVGTHSEEFGAVTIRTVLGREQVSAHISFDSEHLGSALSTQLSSLQESIEGRLQQSMGVRASVSVSAGTGAEIAKDARESAGGNASGQPTNSSARNGSGQRQQGNNPSYFSNDVATGGDRGSSAAAYSNPALHQGRLDIRI